jgi:antirestriction protein ArdC
MARAQKRQAKGTPKGGEFAEDRKPDGPELRKPAKTEAMLAELSAGVRDLTTSEKWTAYLDTQSKFHAYSFNNALLIALQNPTATRVAGYNKWKELDHQVKKGEHGIVILAPIVRTKKDEDGDKEKDKKYIAGFTTVSVFDVSQTDGPPLPEAVTKLEGVDAEGQFKSLSDVAETFGFSVEKVDDATLGGANGDCDPRTKRIRVKASNGGKQQVKTLAHELGHALLHEEDSDLPRGHKEVEAESVAYVVSQSLGIDSSDYSFGYLAHWLKGDPDEAEKTIKSSGMRIQKAAHQIIEAFDKIPVTA